MDTWDAYKYVCDFIPPASQNPVYFLLLCTLLTLLNLPLFPEKDKNIQ